MPSKVCLQNLSVWYLQAQQISIIQIIKRFCLGQISEESSQLKQNRLKKHPFYISFAENGFQTVKSLLEEHTLEETQGKSMSLAFF